FAKLPILPAPPRMVDRRERWTRHWPLKAEGNMSATFHVFPAIDHVPTFGEVLEVAHGHLSAFLRTCDIHYPVRFDVGLRDSEKRAQAIDLHGPARWPEDQCAWFHVPGVNGG